MVIKELFGFKQKGRDCVQNQDGSENCTVFEKSGTELVATGTNFNVAVDPQTCQPMLVGHNRILDNDAEYVKETFAQKKAGCQKGIA